MTQLANVIELEPMDEAMRLWGAAVKAREAATGDLVALQESLDLGLRAAEIMVIHLLQPAKDTFPDTIGVQLALPPPEVDAHRDGVNVPKMLQFHDVVDMLSATDLDCVSPGMHKGWEDRRSSCRRSRSLAQETIGVTLSAADQDQLLLLAAYRNRLFRYPPPVRVVPGEILPAFRRLERLMDGLLKAAKGS
ncbi:MAG: hypothetical protein JSW43_02120 [Gemmatimonadota bacterium]|nr:MAG: hypothetical protein JSW43_02120 [Gemmatimonadota bacterium]